ncbi:MAG: HNH endonuclease [Anaerolineae bacterium]|uniref:HNH endonuclease n=1 Tax=Candidatus Amarolinea dominans TaxID=3140696 RepID=UPI001D226CE0|nr:HNH endonuclease [Anaerolineae bacterium]MBK7199309.1 HNH endonuclease [Anaerolineae bacterium]MBK9093425.1 HNH endonuclease [Anaerolineae bacterium]MBK9230612.1 HNH endonuclease [Anaerolineae bacterium]
MGNVLVLNASYEPLSVVSVRRAIVLLLKEKAELVEAAEAYLRAEQQAFRVPLVIRLVCYVRIPMHLSLPLSRRTVISRDHYTCQYCGCQFGRSDLTLDHVVPRSRGGATAWENVVAACRGCNQRKGNRTPDEAGYALLSVPRRPRYIALTLLNEYSPGHHSSWQKYLY